MNTITIINNKPKWNRFRNRFFSIALLAIIYGMATPVFGQIYVKENGTGTGTGSSWDNAFSGPGLATYLKNNILTPGTKIYFAAGTYVPNASAAPTASDRDATFTLTAGVEMYGGYPLAATGTTLSDRDIVNNKTILSGEIGNQTVTTDNSYHVVTINGSNAKLDGFTVTGGNATPPSDVNGGGGILIDPSLDVTLSDLIVTKNIASYGGGISSRGANADGTGTFSLFNVTVSYNTSTTTGGGISVAGNSNKLIVTGGSITNNTATGFGGGIYSVGTLTLDGVNFSNNTSSTSGGGVCITTKKKDDNNYYNAYLILKGSLTFDHNTAGYGGGGLFAFNASYDQLVGTTNKSEFITTTTDLTSIVVTNNIAVGGNGVGGGGIYTNQTISLKNATITGNIANKGNGGGIVLDGSATNNPFKLSFENSTITNNKAIQAAEAGRGGGIWTAGPLDLTGVTNVDDNEATGQGGGMNVTGQLTLRGTISISRNKAGTVGGGIQKSTTDPATTLNASDPASHITMDGNTAGDAGGAIFIAADMIATNLTLKNNVTTKYIAANSPRGGGGISTSGVRNVTISNSTINNNSAYCNGGGIRILAGTLILENVTVSSNKAGWNPVTNQLVDSTTIGGAGSGGGIYAGGTTTFRGSLTFENNLASNCGGGIYKLDNSSVTTGVSSMLLNNNEATVDGGGYYHYAASDLSISGWIVSNNRVGNDGGGIYFRLGYKLTLVGGRFEGNTAGNNGGGIFGGNNSNTKVDANGTTFIKNESKGTDLLDGGGGIYINKLYNVTTESVTFTQNKAVNDSPTSKTDKLNHPVYIKNTTYTAGFSFAYNNYDINYIGIVPVNDYAITDSKPVDLSILLNDTLIGYIDLDQYTVYATPGALGTPKHGTIVFNDSFENYANKTVTYTPAAGFTGIDSCEYTIKHRTQPNRIFGSAKVYIAVVKTIPGRVCEGNPVAAAQVTLSIEPATVSPGTITYEWYSTETGGIKIGNTANTTTVSKTGWGAVYRWVEAKYNIPVKKQDGTDSIISLNRLRVKASFIPNLMYWKQNATNSNWNDPANWVQENGATFADIDAVPMECTDVHIPGNANKNGTNGLYPSLDLVNSPITTYPSPVCHYITFHFGGEVAKPHLLRYTRAYIHYNFGKYATDKAGGLITNTDAAHSATEMARNRWYTLAAPLKMIASGDFSFGGFPYMWQQGFKTSTDRSGELMGVWYAPENTMNWELGTKQNYAISVFAAEFNAGLLGEKDHTNLNGLGGILKIPYLEDNNSYGSGVGYNNEGYHRLHTWEKNSTYPNGVSTFSYFWGVEGYPIEPSQKDIFPRGEESYRFVFEGSDNQARDPFKVTVNVVNTNPPNSDPEKYGDYIMVGNPFLSSLDFDKFLTENTGKLANHYLLYEDGGSFKLYQQGTGGYQQLIAPLQAFFIKPIGTAGSTVDLSFTSAMSVTRSSNRSYQLRSLQEQNVSYGEMDMIVSNKTGSTRIIFTNNPEITGKRNITRLLSTDNPALPQLYSLDEQGHKNTLHILSGVKQIVIPIGIYGNASGNYQFSFENIESLNFNYIILRDKVLNKEIDLLKSPAYSFENTTGNLSDRFELITAMKNQSPTGFDEITNQNSINISLHNQILQIESPEGIAEVEIINTQGQKVFSDRTSGNNNHYTKELDLKVHGVYIVSVKRMNGKTEVRKLAY